MSKKDINNIKLSVNGVEIKPADCNISYEVENKLYSVTVTMHINDDGMNKLRDSIEDSKQGKQKNIKKGEQ